MRPCLLVPSVPRDRDGYPVRDGHAVLHGARSDETEVSALRQERENGLETQRESRLVC